MSVMLLALGQFFFWEGGLPELGEDEQKGNKEEKADARVKEQEPRKKDGRAENI